MEEKLKSIYYDPSLGFTDINKFWKRVQDAGLKINYSKVKEFYNNQAINQVYHNKIKQETRTPIIAYRVGECLQCDLMEIKKFKFKNSNNKYILNVIDVNSRYVWSFPLKTKTAKPVFECMEKVYKEIADKKFKIFSLTTDTGSEFENKYMNDLNKKYKVKHYTIVSKNKGHPTITGIIERFNRTLWSFISKYTEANDSVQFIDVLQKFITNYNSNIHSTIGEKPIDVYNGKVLPNQKAEVAEKFKIGDYVRVRQRKKKLGAKSYDFKYSRIIYEIVENSNGHTLKNLTTNHNLQKKYQYADLQYVPKETVNINASKKAQEISDIEAHETMKRKNKREFDSVDDKTGKPVVSKRLIPKDNKRSEKVDYKKFFTNRKSKK